MKDLAHIPSGIGMDKQYGNGLRPIYALYFIFIPLFILCLIVIYQMQFNNYVPSSDKGNIVYFIAMLSFFIGGLAYIIQKVVSKRVLTINEAGISFGSPHDRTTIEWNNINKVMHSESMGKSFIETKVKINPLADSQIEFPFSHYLISTQELFCVFNAKAYQYKFEVEVI